jgi:hypothetical protein
MARIQTDNDLLYEFSLLDSMVFGSDPPPLATVIAFRFVSLRRFESTESMVATTAEDSSHRLGTRFRKKRAFSTLPLKKSAS